MNLTSQQPAASTTKTPPDLRELAASVPCDECPSTGLCAGCAALASLIEAEIRIRQGVA